MKHTVRTSFRGRHCPCARTLHAFFPELRRLRLSHERLIDILQEKTEYEPQYCDHETTIDLVGISESTLLRYQNKGRIIVAKMEQGKKYYLRKDVERFKREYWGR